MRRTDRRGHALSRLVELLGRRRGPTYRMAPPLRNAHYLGLHIAAASRASALDA